MIAMFGNCSRIAARNCRDGDMMPLAAGTPKGPECKAVAERKGFEPSRRLNTICALSRGSEGELESGPATAPYRQFSADAVPAVHKNRPF